MKRRVRVLVSGRVQGVWFRDSTQKNAEKHGVTGWVRNHPDGRVEALFDGEAEAVKAMVAFVHEGPTHARVDGIEVTEEPPDDNFAEFQIR